MASTNEEILRHVVLLKFKDDTKSEDIARLEQDFRTLATVKIKEVKQFEWGTHTNIDHRNQGYTHCFCISFANQKDLDTYIEHPDHKEFVSHLKVHLAGILVVDYYAKS